MTQDTTIILRKFDNEFEANMIQDKLDACGIPSFIENGNPVGINPLGLFELKIFSRDKEKAESVLSEPINKPNALQ